jgi:hypothetical protein
MIAGGNEAEATAPSTPTTARTTTATTTTAPATRTVSGLETASYDPEGDGDEHPEETDAAIDGDPATLWRTDTYRATPEFAGIKPGVGLVLATPSAVTATRLRLRAGAGGWTGRVYTAAGTAAPPGIAGWTPASAKFTASDAPMSVPLTGGPSRLYLIWITRLAPVDTGFAASIAEAALEETAAK